MKMKMKRTAVITTLSALIGLGIVGVSPAFAGSSCITYGGMTDCRYDDGATSTTIEYGGMSNTYGRDNDGDFYSSSCITYGGMTSCN